MKKAFDANVSRSKPRVRLGALMAGAGLTQAVDEANSHTHSVSVDAVEAIAEQVARSELAPDLSAAVRNRQAARNVRVTATTALQQAIEAPVAEVAPQAAMVAEPARAKVDVAEVEVNAPVEAVVEVQQPVATPVAKHAQEPVMRPSPRNHAEAPATVTEVQAPAMPVELEPAERRERLKERLRSVRENPRPEPLPETVAEAGVLAVERIAALQTELAKARTLNLALTQDLEAARRQAERATEEARLRMDEARRLSSEMEGRVKLLTDLERELESLESERNEALLALQESRQALDAGANEKVELQNELLKRATELNESLAEEERLAGELESAQETMGSLRRAADVLKTERDTLARQVSDLTRERAELLEARKALEAVHRALSHASVKR